MSNPSDAPASNSTYTVTERYIKRRLAGEGGSELVDLMAIGYLKARLDDIERLLTGLTRDQRREGFIPHTLHLWSMRPLTEWRDTDGPCLWWAPLSGKPPFCGTPHDSAWLSDYTHWSLLPPAELMWTTDNEEELE